MDRQTLYQAVHEHAEAQFVAAQRRYNERFNQQRYVNATKHLSGKTANALIDDALVLCGSPYHKLSCRRWSTAALEFLALFTGG